MRIKIDDIEIENNKLRKLIEEEKTND